MVSADLADGRAAHAVQFTMDMDEDPQPLGIVQPCISYKKWKTATQLRFKKRMSR